MNDNQRKLISYNLDKLIYVTDYETMINSCLRKDIITQVMADIIDQDGRDELDRKRLLFQKLTHRGPTAFHKILEILQENDFKEAHALLSTSTIPSATFSREQADVDENNAISISVTKNKYNRSVSQNSPINNNNGNANVHDEADRKIIEIDGNLTSKQKKKSSKLVPYEGKTSFQFDPSLEVKRAANYGIHPKLQVYSMKSKRRGVFFFVNIIKFKSEKLDRQGAEKDRENLITLFKEMNYTVFYFEDITRPEFLTLMNELIASDYIKHVDSFICCIQTHGDLHQNNTIMEFADGLSLATEQVVSLFSNINCPSLTNKPKVFFFPFCRGKISDKLKKVSMIQTDGIAEVPSYNDILICYGTVPGFSTHRDTGFGSWYVREMCKIFAEHACDSHIEDMLKMVGAKTLEITDAGRVQVASTESRGFNRLMFFNPKISD